MHVSPDTVNHFFAYTPWVVFLAILLVVYYATRSVGSSKTPIGKTYACADCGRRGNHEHMVPVNQGGSVVWYCSKHAGSH